MRKKRVWLCSTEELASCITQAGEVATAVTIRQLPEVLRGLSDHPVVILAEPGQEIALLAILRDCKGRNVSIWVAGEFPVRSPRFHYNTDKRAIPGGEPVTVTEITLAPRPTSTWQK